MGIIVKEQESKRIVLYLKGADTVMEPKVSTMDSDFMIEACSDLAREGLRTLVITQKLLSQSGTNDFIQPMSSGKRLLMQPLLP